MRRRIIWHPERGIDKTLPKIVGETCDRAFDADDISVYNEKIFGTRKSLKTVDGVNYSSVYGIQKYQRGLAVACSSGLFLDGTSILSTSYNSFVWMAAWHNILFVSNGTSWKKVYLNDHAYTIGIAPPTDLKIAVTACFNSVGNGGSWDLATLTLTETLVTPLTTHVGDYVQVYDKDDALARCFTGIAKTVDAGAGTIVIDIDPLDTAPPTDASGVTYWVSSPNRTQTKYSYDLRGSTSAIYWKYRFYRRDDGTRSNTVTCINTNREDGKFIHTDLVGHYTMLGFPNTCTDSDVDRIEVFRLDTSVDTSDLYRLVATKDLATANASWVDSASMSQTLEALDDDLKYPCPSILKGLLVYGSRLWGHTANKVYYSEAYQTTSQFEYFGGAGLNFFDFPDTVQAILDYGRTLIVFLERETWVLEGNSPESMNQRRLNEDIGTYGALSVARYGGNVFTVSSDMRLWQISGSAWHEQQQVTSVLPSSPTYVQLTGSDGSLWITTGNQVVRYSLTNQDVWVYSLSGYVASGSHKTYLGQAGHVYEIDSPGGSEVVPSSFIESPDLFIGTDVGLRGKFNRILFRANCTSGTITIFVDGKVWKEVTFSTQGEQTVIKHFWPVQGYYVKVRISSSSSLILSGPIILNPW